MKEFAKPTSPPLTDAPPAGDREHSSPYGAVGPSDAGLSLPDTLRWLQRSIAVHEGRGSAGFYHLWRGWSASYPETTGYVVETLWDYYHRTGDESLRRDALSCTDWLCDIQLHDGAWPGGVGGVLPPVVFDTGMILFGLTRSFTETGSQRYADAVQRALQWLLALLEPDGSWQKAAYVPGFVPSYYTRAVWAVLYAGERLQIPGVRAMMEKALAYYAGLIVQSPSVPGWGFRPGEPAFTHTITYTWRGFLESALLLGNDDIITKAAQFGRKIMELRARRGWLPGAFDENWNGDWSFTCVTGNAQLSIFLHRLYIATGDALFQQGACILYEDAAAAAWTRGGPALKGAVPGSQPLWGKYLPYRFPNWAAKFLLDAALVCGGPSTSFHQK